MEEYTKQAYEKYISIILNSRKEEMDLSGVNIEEHIANICKSFKITAIEVENGLGRTNEEGSQGVGSQIESIPGKEGEGEGGRK